MERANFNGLSQIGAPTSTRSSASTPMVDTTAQTAMTAAHTSIGRCHAPPGEAG